MAVLEGLIGQEQAAGRLAAAATTPVHAYLFAGPPGSGKRDAARAFAAALLCTNGCDGTCDVFLPERNVSRRHARLERDAHGRWCLVDLGAPYGSFVNGLRVEAKVALSPGDVVRVKVLEVDRQGRIRLSMRDVDAA